MAVSVVNTAGGNYTNSTGTHSVATGGWSSDFTPTAGNTLLLTLHVGPNSTRPASPPTGWTELEGGADGAPFGNVSYIKENISSSDTNPTINGWSTGGQTGRWSVIEFTGVPTSGAWGPSAKGVEATGATTVSAGPTSSLSQGTGLSIGIFVVDNGNNMDGAWSSGTWTTIVTQNRTTSGGHTIARRDLSGTSGISATYSGYTSDQSWIAVAALYDDAGGDPTVALTGASTTSATGVLAPSTTVALAGASATTATGTITPTQAATVALTGEAVTAATGSITAAISVALTGEAVTAATGTITPTQAATEALTGQAVTATAGNVGVQVDATVALSGESTTTATGTVGATTGAVVDLTGAAATTAAGTLGVQVDATRPLTGQAATAATGTVAPSVGAVVALTGQGATAALGSVSPAISVNLSGIALTTTAGVAAPAGDAEVALTGQDITISAGTIAAATPDVTLALSGLSMTTARGTIFLQGVWSPVNDEAVNTWIPVVDTAANTWATI